MVEQWTENPCVISSILIGGTNEAGFRKRGPAFTFFASARRPKLNSELFVICDFAQDEGGKLTVFGIFDTLFAREFPAVHPLLCVAARLRFAIYELGAHPFTIAFVDTQGHPIAPPFEGRLEVNGIGYDSATANIALKIRDFQLPGEASWRAVLTVDGNEVGKVPLRIRRAPSGLSLSPTPTAPHS